MTASTKNDITAKADVDHLVRKFYEKATVDPLIGHFFTTVVQLDWETHIPRIVNFWSSMLLGDQSYSGNPMDAHIHLNKLSPLQEQHFNRWIQLWTQTVQENFEGPKADEAIQRAATIAHIMSLKMHQ